MWGALTCSTKTVDIWAYTVLKMMVAIMMGKKPSIRFTSSTCVTVYSHFSLFPGCFGPLLVAALSRHLQQPTL